jgi:UDPglucose--hexose-1-phosphate uridylyltransferase
MDLRKDPITRSWVLVGGGEVETPAADDCPYCVGANVFHTQPILSVATEGQPGGIRVYPHPNPLYGIEGDAERRAEGIYDRMRRLGAHELIIESPDHSFTLTGASQEHVADLLRCWALRVSDLKNDPRFRYVTVCRNRGELAGQQISHPHSELTATTFIPRRLVYELRAAREYFEMKERCVFCDIQQQEEQQGLRVVDLTPRFVAVCPFASRVPYEVWILPRYHYSSFEADLMRHPDQTELAGILQRTLARLEQLTRDYHLVLHTSPNTHARTELGTFWTTIDDDYHWHIEILPITEKRSKSYSIKEVYYCSMTPEEAAYKLRELPGVAGSRRQTWPAVQS